MPQIVVICLPILKHLFMRPLDCFKCPRYLSRQLPYPILRRLYFLLGLREMGGGILEMLAFLPGLANSLLLPILFLGSFSLNCVETHCLKDLLSLWAVSLSHPDS